MISGNDNNTILRSRTWCLITYRSSPSLANNFTRKHRPIHARRLGRSRNIELTQQWISRCAQSRQQAIQGFASFGEVGKPAAPLQYLHFALEYIEGAVEQTLQRVATMTRNERVRIVAVRERHDAYGR